MNKRFCFLSEVTVPSGAWHDWKKPLQFIMYSKYNFVKICRDEIYMLMCVILMYSYKCVGPKPEKMVMGIFFII